MAMVLAQPKTEGEEAAQVEKAQAMGAPDPVKQERLRQLFARRSELTNEQRAQVEQAIRDSGIDVETAQKILPSDPPSAMQVLNEDYVQPAVAGLKAFGKENVLPLGLQLSAQAVGSRFGIPSSISGPIGAGVGKYLNYPLGLEKAPEESITGLPPTLEGPLATMLLTGGVNLLTRPALTNLPGAQAGKQELGASKLRTLEQNLRPAVPPPSEALYQAISAGPQPKIPMGPLSTSLTKLRNEFGSLARNQKLGPTAIGGPVEKSAGILGKIRQYQQNLTYYQGGWPLEKFRNEMKALNADIGSAEASGGADLGALRSMKKAMWDSLEQSGAGSAPLKAANTQYMHEIASDELANILKTKGLTFKQTHGYLLPEVNPAAVKNALTKLPEDSLITKSLSKQLPAIQKTLDELASIPKLESEGGISTKFGSPGRLVAGLGSGAIGAALGGGIPGSAAGAAAGIGVYEATAKLLMSPRGRAFMVNLLKANGGHWTSTMTSMVTNAASNELYGAMNPPTVPEQP